MSDTKTPTPADVAEKTAAATEAPQTDAPAQETDWKAEARKWEQRAKENRTAAEKLAELEQAQMSEAERAAAKVKAAEDRAAELEARNNIAEVAIEYGLSKDDAQLLKGVSDIETMRQIAERLSEPKNNRNHYVPNEGTGTTPPPDERREFANFLAGRRA